MAIFNYIHKLRSKANEYRWPNQAKKKASNTIIKLTATFVESRVLHGTDDESAWYYYCSITKEVPEQTCIPRPCLLTFCAEILLRSTVDERNVRHENENENRKICQKRETHADSHFRPVSTIRLFTAQAGSKNATSSLANESVMR